MNRRTARFVGLGLALCLLLAGFVSYYASAAPDGLEKVAADQGFLSTARSHPAQGPLAGYSWDGLGDGRLSGGLAGVVGALLTLLLAGALFAALARHRKLQPDQEPEPDREAEPAEQPAARSAADPAAQPAGVAGDRFP